MGISVFRVSWIRVFLRAHFRVEIDYLRNTFALTVVFCRINEVHLKFCVKSLDCQSEQFNKKWNLTSLLAKNKLDIMRVCKMSSHKKDWQTSKLEHPMISPFSVNQELWTFVLIRYGIIPDFRKKKTKDFVEYRWSFRNLARARFYFKLCWQSILILIWFPSSEI